MNLQMITAANSLNQLQHKVDLISHNVANINTVGYKRSEAVFQDLLTQTLQNQPHKQKEIGRITPFDMRMGHGMKLSQTLLRLEQGSVQVTERPLDFMIEGEKAFFQVARYWTDENGDQQEEFFFTRSGAFHLEPLAETEVSLVPNEDGVLEEIEVPLMRLVNQQGLPVIDELGLDIRFPSTYGRIEVTSEGRINAYNNNDDVIQFRFGMALIERPELLLAMGNGQYRLQGNLAQLEQEGALMRAPANEGAFVIRQGALEMSNVDLTHEMTQLIATQRLMQFQARSISIADDMLGLANSIRG